MRTTTTLLWVKVAFWVVSALVLLLVPVVRNQFVYSYGNPSPSLGTGFLILLGVFLTLATLYVVAWTVVVTVLLQRGHRWVRTAVLVFATLTVLGLVSAGLRSAVYAVGGLYFSDTPPSLLTVAYLLVSAVLYAAVLALLFRPASRQWLDERTAQRRWVVQQRRAATTGGAR